MGCCGSAQNEDKNSANTKAGSKQDGGETKTVQSKKAGMEKYELLKVLGTGASCEVHCVKEKETGKMYAMKIMQKSQPYNKTLYETEIAVLALLSHPNLLEMAEHFEDKKAFYIVSAFYRGGELFDRVQKGSFSERDASRLAKEMLLGLGYCHKKNVVHRDLKPENFVFETAEADSHMKLIDFGCAKHVEDDELVLDYAGSPYYVAPEVLKADAYKRTGKIWKAADMWSVGVIIFLLVCGWPPFNGRNQKEIFDSIAMGKYRFPSAKEHPLSESVKGLIRSLLVMDPLKRATAEQCLQHPWIAGDEAPKNPLPESVLKGLSNFQSQCRLKKAVARGMANRMTPDDKASLAGVFKRFDLNGDGKLGPDEIAAMMRFLGQAEVDAKEVMKQLDENQDGSISQEEFATAQTLGKLESSNEQKNAFAMVDKDKDGFVSRQELEELCNINPDAAKALISDVDVNKDGRISMDEWLTAMNNEAAKKKQKSRTSNAPQPSQA